MPSHTHSFPSSVGREQSAVNRKVTGSNPVGSVDFIFYYLQLNKTKVIKTIIKQL